ncbi:sigma factor-like helix-turn-helix DNA-binding protein [uncultured Fusobacterium sp.]|uniref:sigma factor-like helix-turn-helix DNA-binding protein n=1 Tax=uncultured Fusobacterium sp. TaxID=159267 RepID=UPI0015A604F0|nr:sigma factor-like helix-turn-helix DNA-binding protein [uncultured Fusobacterium sp.]DAQ00431.1 MAG TPA: Sigma-70, region 4 [Caudoviricetes sp.]
MNFKDFLNNKCESVFSHRDESELMEAKKKIKNYFMKNILEFCLTPKEKQIYLMKNREKLTHKEIAKTLGISKITSRNILYRANKKINRISKQFQEEE